MDCDAKIVWKGRPGTLGRTAPFKMCHLDVHTGRDGMKYLRVAATHSTTITDVKVNSIMCVSGLKPESVTLMLQHNSISEISIKNAPPHKLAELVSSVKPPPRPPCKTNIASRTSYGAKMVAAAKSFPSPKPQSYSFAKVTSPRRQVQSTLMLPLRTAQKRPLSPKPLSDIENITPPKKVKHEGRVNHEGYLTGFSNNGNTCYINAVLQAVLNQRCFVVDVVKLGIHKNDQNTLYFLLNLLIKCKYGVSAFTSHDILVRKMQNLTSSNFAKGKQHDAHEWLNTLLHLLRSEVERVSASGVACPVDGSFKTMVQQTIKCGICKETRTNYQYTYEIGLTITSDAHLQQLINDYFKEDTVTVQCPNCGINTTSSIKHQISCLPRVMIVILKRYSVDDAGHTYKRRDSVTIPPSINVSSITTPSVAQPSPFIDDTTILSCRVDSQLNEQQQLQLALTQSMQQHSPPPANEPDTTTTADHEYQLNTVISHLGKAPTTGHYISELLCSNTNSWWCFNDNTVTMTSLPSITASRCTTAYILFYTHNKSFVRKDIM